MFHYGHQLDTNFVRFSGFLELSAAEKQHYESVETESKQYSCRP